MPDKDGASPFPLLLSMTGAFSHVATLTPAAGLVPYTVNSPLWSDGTAKRPRALRRREQIGFTTTGEWSYPNGSVFVKHFKLVVHHGTSARRRLETRLLLRDGDGKVLWRDLSSRVGNVDSAVKRGRCS